MRGSESRTAIPVRQQEKKVLSCGEGGGGIYLSPALWLVVGSEAGKFSRGFRIFLSSWLLLSLSLASPLLLLESLSSPSSSSPSLPQST
jgi:hypothetical protein